MLDEKLSSDAKALDGLNVQVAVCDEIASHKTAEVYETLLTAMGKRRHPLVLSISTATGNTAGIGHQLWDYGARVLTGAQQDERLFVLIYTADDTDNLWDEATWRKCNPSQGRRSSRRDPGEHAVGQKQPGLEGSDEDAAP